jgi:hypothetical protein
VEERRSGDQITLREYVDARFAAQERAFTIMLQATERAFVAQFSAAERMATLMADNEALKNNTGRLQALTTRVDADIGQRRGMGKLIGWIVSAVFVIVAVAGLFFRLGHGP